MALKKWNIWFLICEFRSSESYGAEIPSKFEMQRCSNSLHYILKTIQDNMTIQQQDNLKNQLQDDRKRQRREIMKKQIEPTAGRSEEAKSKKKKTCLDWL